MKVEKNTEEEEKEGIKGAEKEEKTNEEKVYAIHERQNRKKRTMD